MAWLTFVQVPRADHEAQLLRQSAVKEAQFGQLDAGRFRSFMSGGGDAVFYAERVDAEGVLHNVFVRREIGGRIEVALADTATYSKAGAERHALRDAVQRPALRRRARAQRFSRDRVSASTAFPSSTPEQTRRAPQDPDTKPTRELLGSMRPSDIAQLQFRASSPIMALVLTLVAVPLSRLRPRQGRYARVGFAIVVYFVYSNLLSACQGLDREGRTAAGDRRVVGAHPGCLAFGLYLVYRERRAAREHARPLSVPHRASSTPLMAMAVLLTLGGLFLFISQQSDIGVGDYSAGGCVPVHAAQPAAAGLRAAADRRADRRADGARQSRGGQRTRGDARLGRLGVAHRLAGGPRGPHARARHVRHRRIRGAAARAVRQAREDHAASWRTSASPARAARG